MGPGRRRRLQQGLHYGAGDQRCIPRCGALRERASRIVQRDAILRRGDDGVSGDARSSRAADLRVHLRLRVVRAADRRAAAAVRGDSRQSGGDGRFRARLRRGHLASRVLLAGQRRPDLRRRRLSSSFHPRLLAAPAETIDNRGMALLWAALAVLLVGALYQRWGAARNRRQLPPPGTLVDVGGHSLHAVCSGAGAPLVLFESGIAASSLSWAIVQPAVAAFTRACAYDRAGLAWSEAPSRPRTFTRIVDELAVLIDRLPSSDRVILVGHSFGAFVVRSYAAREPHRIGGLVLVDPATEWLQMTPGRARLIRGGRQLSKI